MPKVELEKDTKKVLDDQKILSDGIKTQFWHDVKKKLVKSIVENSSLNRINIQASSSNEAITRELTARALLSNLLLGVLTDVEGQASQYEENVKLLEDTEDEEIMKFFPEKEN